jgi:hypothetical protein
MVVGEVDDTVGFGRPGPQAVGIVEVAAVHLSAQRRDGGCGVVRAGQAQDPVSGVDQVGDDRGADPAGGSGDEDAHETLQGDVAW